MLAAVSQFRGLCPRVKARNVATTFVMRPRDSPSSPAGGHEIGVTPVGLVQHYSLLDLLTPIGPKFKDSAVLFDDFLGIDFY